jgi:DNA-binding XRE family transcriptional regulator
MARRFCSGISARYPADKYILYQDDYSNRKDIPALPFSYRTKKVRKPLGDKYIDDPKTIGDHIRNKRLELGRLQKDIAKQIGVTEDCITLWELNKSVPTAVYMPKIIQFLGYVPTLFNRSTIGGKIKLYRLTNGLSHKKMGSLIGVDASTIGSWENGDHLPSKLHSKRLNKLLGTYW